MKKILRILAVAFILATCRPYFEIHNDALAPPKDYDFSRIFETFWHGMSRNYVFWSEEPSFLWDPLLNALPQADKEIILRYPESFWDMIYGEYKPKFEALGYFRNTQSPGYAVAAEKAYGYFLEMTVGLRDGHLQIIFNPAALDINGDGIPDLPPVIIPGNNREMVHYATQNDPPFAEWVFFVSDLGMDAPVSVFDTEYFTSYNFVDRNLANYVKGPGGDPLSAADVLNAPMGDMPSLKIVSGEIPAAGGKILYLFFNYTFLADWGAPIIEAGGNPAVSPFKEVIEEAESLINDRFLTALTNPDVKGVIVDLRGNTGGAPPSLGYLIGRMISSPLTYTEARIKSGEGRLDYGPWVPMRITPAPATEKRLHNTNVPVVVLVNKGTKSGAEFLTAMVKAMPNGTVVGETTSGAFGNPGDPDIYNAGRVYGGAFWSLIVSTVAQFKLDGKIIEGFGITPDVHVPMNRSDWVEFYGPQMKDKQLEAAIRVIDPAYVF